MKIVIACDGSEFSNQAIKLTAALPLPPQSAIHFVHVAPLIEYDGLYLSPKGREEILQFNRELKDNAREILEQSSGLLAQAGHSIHTQVLTGSPTQQLATAAAGADLLVLGSRGLNPFKGFLLGSVSDALLRHAPCSVLIYRGHAGYKIPSSVSKIGVGFDDTATSRLACRFLNKFDLKRVQKVELIAVMQMSAYYSMSYTMAALETWPQYKKALEESMLEMQNELSDANPSVVFSSSIRTEATDAANELNSYCHKSQMDLIVVGSKGKGVLDKVLLGSVSSKLAHHAELPLLVVR